MNLRFWKKKPPDVSDTADEAKGTKAAPKDSEDAAAPTKPGRLARLKAKLPSRKKPPVEVDGESEPPIKEHHNKHEEEGVEVPVKLGLVSRLKGVLVRLLRSLKRKQPEPEEAAETPIPARKRRDKAEEEEVPPPPAGSGKKKLLALAMLVPLAAGIGFAAWKLLPSTPAQHEPPAAAPAPETAAPQAEVAPTPAPAEPKSTDAQPFSAPITAPGEVQATAEATEPPAQPSADATATAPTDTDIQAQLEALKKQNEAMQAQIEMLKQQSVASKPAKPGSATLPKEGVLVIGGKNNKENAQSLKKVIEEMNAASDRNAPKK